MAIPIDLNNALENQLNQIINMQNIKFLFNQTFVKARRFKPTLNE